MRYFKTRPIKHQLLFVLFLFVFILVLVMTLTYKQSTKIIYQKNEGYSVELLDKITQYVESRMGQIEGLINNTGYNNDVLRYLKVVDVLEKYDLFRKVDSQLTTMTQLEPGIVDIILLGNNGNNINPVSESNKQKAVLDAVTALSRQTDPSTKMKYSGLIHDTADKNLFIIGSRVNNIFPVTTLGYLIVILDLNAIFPEFDTMLENGFGHFYVLDRNGIICASNEKQRIGEKFAAATYSGHSQEANIVHEMDLPEIQGKVVNIYSKSELFRGMDQVRLTYLWILALFLPFICFFLWVISRNVIEPIRSFMRFIQLIKSGTIYRNSQRLQLAGYYEIMVMADKFNEMLDQIDELTGEVVATNTKIYALEMMKKQAELAYLKQQMNPHFLYNTLESLKGMANEIGATELREMISALGRMLRYNIKGQDEVWLAGEWEIAQAYIKLQQFRFQGRFDVHVDFEEVILHNRVMKMILQPILENAITHGLECKMEKGNLWIEGRRTANDHVEIRIKDDGEGMDQQKVESLVATLTEEGDFLKRFRQNEHLGILNVHNRLRSAYGAPFGLTLHSVPGKGTEVTLLLPGQ